jgi:hypothetical protein
MRIDAFRPVDDFKNNMDNWIDSFKIAARIDENQGVIIPGEPEYFSEIERIKNGIPLNEKVILDLQDLAQKFNLSL